MTALFDVRYLELDSGKRPYIEWEKKLDLSTRNIIRMRINRIRLGNFGDCKTISGQRGLYELRIHYQKGYRIYFSKRGEKIIILLCAGDKNSQKRDIERARDYLSRYKESEHGSG